MKRHASKGQMRVQSCGLFPLLKSRALPAVIHSVAFYLSEAERKSTSHLLVQSGQPPIAADGPSTTPPLPHSHPPESEHHCVRAHWFHILCPFRICARTSMCASVFGLSLALFFFFFIPLDAAAKYGPWLSSWGDLTPFWLFNPYKWLSLV